MGIEIQSLRLLLRARRTGVDFSNTLTIGRQDLIATPEQVADVFARFGETVDAAEATRIADDRFSNALFARLGAGTVDAMDISDFEGATVIHDLNRPLPPGAGGRFSLVFDGGTLEHVFACQTALATYMALPKVGGHLIVAVPSNNECGHGFYQFSPEFFFRTLTPANGYAIEGVYLVPMFVDADWLAVRDPAAVGGRVGHNASRRSTYIFVVAKRVADVVPFTQMPQQSDYVADWEAGTARESGPYRPRRSLAARVAGMLPAGVVETLLQLRAARARPDPRMLTRFVPERG